MEQENNNIEVTANKTGIDDLTNGISAVPNANEQEIDISSYAHKIIKFGIPGLIIIAVLCASIIWYVQYGIGNVIIDDAKVASTMVGARTKAAGTVTEILVNDGDYVEAGTVVARIKVNVTPEQIKQLEQTVVLAQKNLEQVKKGVTVQVPVTTPSAPSGGDSVDVSRAASRAERMQQLFEMGAISAAARDQAQAEYEMAKASASVAAPSVTTTYRTVVQPPNPDVVANAEKQVRQAQAALEAAKTSSQATDIVANTAGTVFLTDIEVGSEVKAGDVILNIGDADGLWVEAYIAPEKEDMVKLGQLVSYRIYRSKYQGTITDIIEPVAADAEQPANTEGSADGVETTDKVIVHISIPAEAMSDIKPDEKVEVTFSK